MGSHVSCWYRQLFELSLNGFRRLCNGTNGPGSREQPCAAGEALGPRAGAAALLPHIVFSPFRVLPTLRIDSELFNL